MGLISNFLPIFFFNFQTFLLLQTINIRTNAVNWSIIIIVCIVSAGSGSKLQAFVGVLGEVGGICYP